MDLGVYLYLIHNNIMLSGLVLKTGGTQIKFNIRGCDKYPTQERVIQVRNRE